MSLDIDILSLFPDYFKSPFEQSLLKRALEKEILKIRHVDIRDFALGKQRRVDDRPFGGGPGMVLMADPLIKAIRSVKTEHSHVVYLSPQGVPLTASKCFELSKLNHMILICGHYEGIDERVIELEVDEEISIGDYVLTSGLAPALVVVDAVSRFLPGVVGDERSVREESFEGEGLLDTTHYTKPRVFEGKEVPQVLCNGNHEEIDKWRYNAAMKKTERNRMDLFLHTLAKKEPVEDVEMQISLLVEDIAESVRFFNKTLLWNVVFKDEKKAIIQCGRNHLMLKKGKKEVAAHILFTVSVTDMSYFNNSVTALKKAGKVIGKLERIKGEALTHQIAFHDIDGYHWILRWNDSSRIYS